MWLPTRVNIRILPGRESSWQPGTLQCSARLAAMQGRNHVPPDDVKLMAEPMLAHRLLISPSARIKNVTQRQIVEDTLRHTPVPGARAKLR